MARFFLRGLLVGAIAVAIAGLIVGLGWTDKADDGLTAPIVIRQEALAEAKREGKQLLMWFTATHRETSEVDYCGLMDQFFADEEVRRVLGKYFVVKRIDIHQVFGGEHVYLDLGQFRGVPAISIFDFAGEVAADSGQDQPTNFGFPMTPQELDAFAAMLRRGCPAMEDAEIKQLEKKLTEKGDKSNFRSPRRSTGWPKQYLDLSPFPRNACGGRGLRVPRPPLVVPWRRSGDESAPALSKKLHREALAAGAVDPETAPAEGKLLRPRREGSGRFPQTSRLR